MPGKLANVHEEARAAVARDVIASELAEGLDGIFTITNYRKVRKYDAPLATLFCKPTRTVANALLIDLEILAIVANYADVHARTILIAEEIIAENSPRLDRRIVIVVHADKNGDAKLRTWGREKGITVIPIHRPQAGAIPPTALLRQRLAADLFSFDPFQVTGPVYD